MCYHMLRDAPLRGVGSGQFTALYHRYMDTYLVPREPEFAQNTYAQLAAQNGAPAALVYLAINVLAWLCLGRIIRGTRDPVRRHLAVTLLALAVSFWFFSLTLDLIEAELGWVTLALSVALWRLHRSEASTAPVRPAVSNGTTGPVATGVAHGGALPRAGGGERRAAGVS